MYDCLGSEYVLDERDSNVGILSYTESCRLLIVCYVMALTLSSTVVWNYTILK